MDSFLCPITHDIMEDPVIGPDGYTYERAAILDWLRQHNTSPMTRVYMSVDNLIPNRALLQTIQEYFINHPDVNKEQLVEILNSQRVNQPNNSMVQNINSIKQSIITIQRDPIHVISVVDVSGSMDESVSNHSINYGFSKLDLVKHSLKVICLSLNPTDLFTLITFSDDTNVRFSQISITDNNEANIIRCIDNLYATNGTNIWSGITAALNIGEKTYQHMSTSINLLTDGQPTGLHTDEIIRYYSYHPLCGKIPITNIGYGYNLDINLLYKLSNLSKGRYLFIPDATMIGTIFVNYMANIMVREKKQLTLGQYVDKEKITVLIDNLINMAEKDKFSDAEYTAMESLRLFSTDSFKDNIFSDNPDKGQIKLAIMEKYYHKWGKYYLPMIINAHVLQECCNFKDDSVQHYGTEKFISLRQLIDQLFSNLPPPKPSSEDRYSVRIGSMSQLNSQDNMCISHTSIVTKLFKDGERNVKIGTIRPGDYLLSADGTYKKVKYVTVKLVFNIDMINIDDLTITPSHPILHNKKWTFPNNLIGQKYKDSEDSKIIHLQKYDYSQLYNIALENGNNIIVDNIPVITLGHGIKNDPVATHEYFGDRILEDLAKMQKSPTSIINLRNYILVRSEITGIVTHMQKNK